ncbi:hypothetical protein [Haliangium sp.]|uniref:hypothetical protein n=1 Tax=Haliangium sp. TaxID=2663208 RepID=UPI003D111992
MSNSSKQRHELSREFARALDEVATKGDETSMDALMTAYDQVERFFLPKVSGAESIELEIKRRVAEMKFYSAIDKAMPYETCLDLFRQIRLLGYTSLEKKGNLGIVFARHCLQNGRDEEASLLLRDLSLELHAALRDGESLVYREMLDQIASIVN